METYLKLYTMFNVTDCTHFPHHRHHKVHELFRWDDSLEREGVGEVSEDVEHEGEHAACHGGAEDAGEDEEPVQTIHKLEQLK